MYNGFDKDKRKVKFDELSEQFELVGGVFEIIAHALPFLHAVEPERALFRGDFDAALPHLWWVLGYTAIALIGAILLFLRQMKKQ